MLNKEKTLIQFGKLYRLSKKLNYVMESLNKEILFECPEDGHQGCEEIERNAVFTEIAADYAELLRDKLEVLEGELFT